MKLLVLTSRFPLPLDKGDKLRIYYQLKELSKHFNIVLVSITDKIPVQENLNDLKSMCKSVYIIRHGKLNASLNTLLSIVSFKKTAAQCAYFYSKKINNKIDSIISAEAPDQIYCQLLRTYQYVKDVEIPKTLDLMDAFSTGAAMRSVEGSFIHKWFWKRESELLKTAESEAVQFFDNTTVISQLDKVRLSHVKGLKVVNNGINSTFFKKCNNPAIYDAVFVGNLGYYPNISAVKYIAGKIIPGYQSMYKHSLMVNIVGPNSIKIKAWESNGLNIGGWYEDVKEGFCSGRVFLAPIFEGIGQQNKILEAMAIGIPCITTPDVAKALGMEHGNQLLTAETAKSFCICINHLLSNKKFEKELVQRAQQFVRSNYKWKEVCQPLINLIKGSKE